MLDYLFVSYIYFNDLSYFISIFYSIANILFYIIIHFYFLLRVVIIFVGFSLFGLLFSYVIT